MKKRLTLLSLGAALVAVPVLAAQGAGPKGDAPSTRAEAQAKAIELFARLDANKDGKLDAADRAVRGAEMRAKAFERLDADKDGNVSKAEWDKHAADRQAKMAERREKRAAAGAPGEAREGKRPGARGHFGKRGGFHGARGDWMKADTDGDKAISQAEFVAAALARFDSVDANKDGTISAEERAAHRTAMKAKRDEWRAKRGGAPATQ
ncbi:MAG TPA: hypothetical protein PKD99_16370 [Sphingopyxis sp.]|nr:hypothetical protein [Sphingopyxis sp.]HMP46676.1 hypothetical protein [Sphingopyxis sp.]HMQ19247.1 hypothetical protein [Sphingopyxis sp.]